MRLSTVVEILALVVALAGVMVMATQPSFAVDSADNQGVISVSLGI